ncbi:MAG: tetratricopeptide repeat protein [Candidatus Babeliaceae bacterium]|nr:tetratricopeptide repeat protein [Candidatus Babeliaceae bacterium]
MKKKISLVYYTVPPFILVLLAIIAYFSSVTYEFQFDDLANIVNNFQVRVGGIHELFFANTRWISQTLNTFYYQLGKFNPFVYRFANITAHILTGVIAYFVVNLMLVRLKPASFLHAQRFTVAFLTAGLFLLHPVQSQTVSYIIQGQLEGLAALVTLSMILFFLLYTTFTSFPACMLALLGMYTCMFLAPGTKEIAIISPLLVLLVDWFFVAQGKWRSLSERWWLHASLFIGIFGMYIYFLKPEYFTTILGLKMELGNNMGNMLTDKVGEKITPIWYFISQFKVILHYIGIFFWPFTMSVDYDWVLVDSFFAVDCLLPFLILVGLAAYTLYRLSKNKIDAISFAIIWYFIAILPRSSIIPSTELVADYKTYLASFGLFFLWAYAVAYYFDRVEKYFHINHSGVHWVLLTIFLIPFGYALHERNKVWRTAEEFWLNILQNAPGKARAYNNYGVSLCAKQKNEEAIPYFKKAMEMDKVYSDPHNNIAVAYGCLGKLDEAIKALENSVRICPVQPEAYNNMASFYLQKNELSKSEELLKIALRLRPHYGKAHFNLGRTFLLMGKKDQAWNCFKTACLKADFDTIDSFVWYAGVSLELKKFDDALLGYRKMLELNPKNRDAISGMVNTYLIKGEPEKALPYFRQLLQLFPNQADLQFKYGEALIATQDYQNALVVFKKILENNPGFVPGYVKVAGCLYKLGNKQEAYDVLEKFLAQNPPQEFAEPVKIVLADMKIGKFK